MKFKSLLILTFSLVLLFIGSTYADEVKLGISGPGVVNDSTFKAGELVSVEIYCQADKKRTGFTLGFSIESDNIKTIQHVKDTSKGFKEHSDFRGYNGWNDKSIWDFAGIFVVEIDWDGKLPEQIGLGGLSIKKGYEKGELLKHLSFDIIVPESGNLVIDSSFFPPGGKWIFSSPPSIGGQDNPKWSGPYKYTVIK